VISPFGRNDKIVRIRAVCHFDEREILASSSTKIVDLVCGVSCVISPFGRNDKIVRIRAVCHVEEREIALVDRQRLAM